MNAKSHPYTTFGWWRNYMAVVFYHAIGVKDHHLYHLSESQKDTIRDHGSVKVKCAVCTKTMNVDFFGMWN